MCELLHGISLIEQPPRRPAYRALSYCWGDPSDTLNIVINGKVVPVTRNLKAALVEIRRTMTTPGLFWIDALCINQADEYEKREQIKNMGMIFQSAERVIAWVGAPQTAQQANMASRYLQDPISVAQLDELSGKAFRACIHAIGVLPFWRRAWIIQELARGEPLDIRYGHLNITWLQLKKALFTAEILPYLSSDFYTLLNVLDRFQIRERDDRTGGRRVALLEALFESRNSLSTDPRDKIYALLGLSSDGDGIVPSPNYYQPWELVYAQAAENIIAGQGKIGAILLAGYKNSKGSVNLPTWVPNWSALSDTELPPWIAKCIEHSANATEVRTARIGRSKATGDIPIRVTESRHLRLPGVIYESIESLFASATTSADASTSNSASPLLVDVRTFAWQLYDAINWTDAEYKDFTVGQHKKWSARITDVSSLIGDKLHVLGLTNSTLENFVEFLRLLLDEYDIRESTHLSRLRAWMQDNGSLRIGQATVREMLQDQLSAMLSFFSKGEDLTVNVIPPPAVPEKPQKLHDRSQSDAVTSEGRTRLATRLERLEFRKSPSPSRRSSEEDRRPSFEAERTQAWFQTSTSITVGETTFRGLSTEKFMTLRSLLTNNEPPAEGIIAAIANGMERFTASRMRLAATGSRLRVVCENAAVGDKIAVLPNCPLPIVLRSVLGSARYNYIGEVYSESFARLFKDDWREKRTLKSWPSVWEVEGVKIEKKDLIMIE